MQAAVLPPISAEEFYPEWSYMAWSLPRYSRSRVDAAGDYLISGQLFDFDGNLKIVNNWRSSHNWPLYVIQNTLKRRAKKINSAAIVAQRLKRQRSIEQKLRDNSYRHLKLTQIQDIGGCRAIMPTIGETLELANVYRQSKGNSELLRDRDYIAQPKGDGYRSVHLVYKYKSKSERRKAFNNHRIEIQIRSQLQHAWATAVEVVSIFAQLPVRESAFESMLMRDPQFLYKWRRFFALMGSVLARRESQQIIANTPASEAETISELKGICAELEPVKLLHNWRMTMRDLPVSGSNTAFQFLIRIDAKTGSGHITSYTMQESTRAFRDYMAAEVPIRNIPSTHVVLVSVESVDELRKAYPNYYADTSLFVRAVQEAIQ